MAAANIPNDVQNILHENIRTLNIAFLTARHQIKYIPNNGRQIAAKGKAIDRNSDRNNSDSVNPAKKMPVTARRNEVTLSGFPLHSHNAAYE